MREAVIVSYARTGLAKSGRGGFNITPPMSMAAHAIKHAVERAGVDKDYVEDCYLGNCAHGAPNIGRQAALLAGMPKSTAGVSVNRFCSSGLQTIAMAANSIRSDGSDCIVAGGVESISIPGGGSPKELIDPDLLKAAPDIFMAMIDTADIVAERYKLSREYQDEYSLESQRRMAAAQQANKFKDEIVPMKTKMKVVDKATKAESIVDYVVDRDECNRPDTTMEGLAKLEPVKGPGKYVTAGNASQLSDGAAAVVLMEAKDAEKRGLAADRPLRRLGVGGLRAGRDGHRPGVRGAEAVEAPRPEGRRYRSLGAQRGVCQPVPVFPRPARHRSRQVQRQWRLDRDRPSLRHDRRAADRPHPAGRTPAQGQMGRRHHVHRRRPGRRRPVRNL